MLGGMAKATLDGVHAAKATVHQDLVCTAIASVRHMAVCAGGPEGDRELVQGNGCRRRWATLF
eukprot:1142300-Pelagomonas_calceolata.AAC.4